jgi:lipopolysaccharide/colanic/teichoic acid biosynthesis glycosyltransferase
VLVGIFERYGNQFYVVEGAWPMILVFVVAYLVSILYLVSSPRTAQKSIFARSIGVLITAYVFSILVLALFRFHFSLGFVAIYFSITACWVSYLTIDQYKKISTIKFGVVKVGNWKAIESLNLQIVSLDNPERDEDYDVLVIDRQVDFDDQWTLFITSKALEGIQILSLNELFEFDQQRISLEHFVEEQLSTSGAMNYYTPIKRTVDFIVGLIAILILAIPVICFVFLIKLTSTGPGIYRQKRIGRHGKEFLLYKLRTMYADAELTGPMFSIDSDPRITKLGKILRKTRIDEWPQFINVLKGEMSVVGPRPERPAWVSQFKESIPYYELRHMVRPGITGWAQIRQGYASGRLESLRKLEYDLYYIKHVGVVFDVAILLETVKVLFRAFKE